ncbi:MAG: hypothetical protein ACKO9I_13430 [Sphaerospermopsis kisseleviana]|uniref:hypothetical protein n=1 Tax=Sphaerospermopsis sp. LEGE 00249 TaxID=1380707 RepID=UPI00164D5969|nr:hypothetical protein [Sphaerospermopsis sp. LEGE 00249]MBC5797502.1 hypothetical protein [Sphaerospermopsis sp. LEGE 00249]
MVIRLFIFFPVTNPQSPVTSHQSPVTNLDNISQNHLYLSVYFQSRGRGGSYC